MILNLSRQKIVEARGSLVSINDQCAIHIVKLCLTSHVFNSRHSNASTQHEGKHRTTNLEGLATVQVSDANYSCRKAFAGENHGKNLFHVR